MSFLDKYNKTINYVFESFLKEELINSFVSFYGKSHERKIKNVINNLIMLRAQPNWGNVQFDIEMKLSLNKIKEHSRVIFNYLNVSYQEDKVLVVVEELMNLNYDVVMKLINEKEFDGQVLENEFNSLKLHWYKYQYYNELRNMNLEQKLFITGRSVETNKYDNLINEVNPEKSDGVAFMDEDQCFLIAIFGYGIDLPILIHEINHLLSRELLLDLGNGTFKKQDGFRNSGDLFYETINDYISMDIFKNLNSRLGKKYDFLLERSEYCSGYLEVDTFCNNPVRDIYNLAKDLICESLINGNGDKFVKVIGKKNYSKMLFLLSDCYVFLEEKLNLNPSLKLEEIVLDEERFDAFDDCLSNIYNQVLEYEYYNERLERQLNELEKNGTIRRL